MKRFNLYLPSLIALSAFVAPFAKAPNNILKTSKQFANRVYCIKIGTNIFLYSNTPPGPPYTCSILGPACTLSTTATAAYFNMNDSNIFPAQSTISKAPIVAYINAGKIYQ